MPALPQAARLALVLVLFVGAPALAGKSLAPRLSTFWDEWLAETGLLLTESEHHFFETLEDDDERELFVRAFWEERGTAALERWSRNVVAADQLRPRGDRARQAILLFGKPASIERVRACGGLRPLRVWRWDPWHVGRQGGETDESLSLVFAQETRLLPDSFAPWDPKHADRLGYYGSADESLDDFLDRVRPRACVDAGLRKALDSATSFEDLRSTMPWPEARANWYGDLLTQAELFGTPRDALFEINYTGTNGRHTILHGVLRLERKRLAELAPGQLFDRVTFVGDIYKNAYLVDSFEVVHHVAGEAPNETLALDLFRGLRPGRYRLDLRVADGSNMTILRTQRNLEVPALESPAPPPPGRQQNYSHLTRGEVVLLDTFPSVEVLPVSSRASSRIDLMAITTGGPIAGVEFEVDGESVGGDMEAPYSVEVELDGGAHEVTAVAIDAAGRPVVSHSRHVEPEDRPFGVYLERPAVEGSAVPVRLSLPQEAILERVECFDGRELVATLADTPLECPPARLVAGGLRYVRVLATLSTGESTEHLLFFGPNAPEGIDVQLVELFLSVFDGRGRPVPGLTQNDFRIWESGSQLELVRLESLADFPLSVTVLMDLSSSMGRLAKLAAQSAERFFEDVMAPEDRASLLAFNDDFHPLVPFTSDITELRLGAEGVRALGSTRLNDGIVWALNQFAGEENRRAMVVLSDGDDVNSDFPFEQVVAAAVEAGVVVYPISIVRRREEPPSHLGDLAARTGGTAFIVSTITELDTAYRTIAEELRSQYLLVYRLADGSPTFAPRPVDVEVMRAGHSTRNLHGYYE